MFNVLVLGSSTLLHSSLVEAEPKPRQLDKKDHTHSTAQKEVNTQSLSRSKATKSKSLVSQPEHVSTTHVVNHNEPHCQIEVTVHKYNDKGHSQTQTKTCLDQKSESEIIEFIKESRKNTCQTPFCGCWLG